MRHEKNYAKNACVQREEEVVDVRETPFRAIVTQISSIRNIADRVHERLEDVGDTLFGRHQIPCDGADDDSGDADYDGLLDEIRCHLNFLKSTLIDIEAATNRLTNNI